MKVAWAVVILSLLTACQTQPNGAGPNLSCGTAGPNTFYFPAGTFTEGRYPDLVPDPSDDIDDEAERREEYSWTLRHFNAASLSCGMPPAEETYRLVWLRSFHVPVTIQIERSGDIYTLDATMSDASHPRTGKPLIRVHHSLSLPDWLRVTNGLKEIDFWNLQPNKELNGAFSTPSGDRVIVTTSKDGARWIIEGRKDRYHVIDRWSEDYDVIAVGRIFVELAQLNIPEEDIY